jgi:hypothetical protein
MVFMVGGSKVKTWCSGDQGISGANGRSSSATSPRALTRVAEQGHTENQEGGGKLHGIELGRCS